MSRSTRTASPASAAERVRPLLLPQFRDAAPAAGGYLDLAGPSPPESTGTIQSFMLSTAVPRVYERWWRPAWGRLAKGLLGPGMADEHRIARLLLGLSPRDGVLDVGCGTGNFTRDFARSVGPDGLVVGIDLSETMLARAVEDTARAGLDQVAYVRGDAERPPFRDSSFDAVCCFAALNLFADPMRAIDAMTRVLTPGGRIALFTSVRGRSAPLRAVESVIGARAGAHMFERDELTGALKRNGFTDISQRVTGITQFVGGRLAG